MTADQAGEDAPPAPPVPPMAGLPGPGDLPASLRRDLIVFTVLGSLGVAASFVSVNIPHTVVFLDGRLAFAFMGFALLRRLWLAILLAVLLSLSGFHVLALPTAVLGNLMIQVPALIVVRAVHAALVARVPSLAVYAAAWLALVLLVYQAIVTPVIHGVVAVLDGAALGPAVLQGWHDQAFLVESILVASVSTAGMVVARTYRETDRHRRELDVTLNSIGEAVVTTDMAGRVTRMNPQAERLTGWVIREARGRPVDEVMVLVNTRTGAPVETPVARVIAEGRTVGLANHTSLVARDGTRYHVADSAAPIRDADGRLHGIVMVFRDVSAEYASHEALAESKRQLDLAVESAELGIWDWRVATGAVDLVGHQAALYGFAPGTTRVPVEAFRARVHPDDWDETWALAIRTAEEGGTFDCTFRIVERDVREGESERWVRALGKALRDADGAVVRVIGTAQDVTARTLSERALRQTVDALSRSNAELERFASIASHDLQEPVRSMVAYAQLLTYRYAPHLDADAREFLGFIEEGAKRMQAQVLDLLEYSRVSAGDRPFRPVPLDGVVAAARKNLEAVIADSGARLEVGPLPTVRGDRVQLVSLMQNLISNAVKFRRPGVAPVVRVRAQPAEDAQVIEVADNGIGIAREDHAAVFKIFKRLHTAQEYPGTGLGLALAQRIAERHGGTITVDSAPGAGSRFRVALPRCGGDDPGAESRGDEDSLAREL
ncbi:sensor histidine kinase [Roseospira goensis]|uniref:histidine kinase n=1 Tax=Roseospira goensis TaxID=391922 RepID=A0A7W6RWX0_9PROT|nr:PAS domain-containing sensor histidine kinase [Roseospira goensis]MBB4284576.1 PAS domain S-box-containing protein [Roseospira goensis]